MNLIGGNIRNLQDNWPSVLLAVAGGVLLSVGNLATQYAFAFVGLSVTEVITASITVVIGKFPLSLILYTFYRFVINQSLMFLACHGDFYRYDLELFLGRQDKQSRDPFPGRRLLLDRCFPRRCGSCF